MEYICCICIFEPYRYLNARLWEYQGINIYLNAVEHIHRIFFCISLHRAMPFFTCFSEKHNFREFNPTFGFIHWCIHQIDNKYIISNDWNSNLPPIFLMRFMNQYNYLISSIYDAANLFLRRSSYYFNLELFSLCCSPATIVHQCITEAFYWSSSEIESFCLFGKK